MDSTLRSNLQEDCLFNEIIPTLQEMATFNVALPLYYDILYRLKSEDELDNCKDELSKLVESFSIEEEGEKYMKQLNVPQLIKDHIDKSFTMISWEVYDWVFQTCRDVFSEDGVNLRRSHIKCLVWQRNEKIDYEKTARKILSHPDFTQVEKFNLMCEFCWEDEIKAFVQSVELQQYMEDFFSAPNSLDRFPTVYYWIRKLKNELHKIQFQPDFDSLERFMLSQNLSSPASVEYFLSSLSEEDQITVVIEMLKVNKNIMLKQKLLLLKLNEFQKCAVISAIPHRIITNFMNNYDFEDARLVWTRVENSMTDDEFITLVKKILKRITRYIEEQFPLMTELWNAASDRHKNYCVYGSNDIIDLFFDRESKIERDRSCLPFLSAILSYASPSYRRDIILERGDVLLADSHPYSEVFELIKFCLPSSGDIAKFKNLVRKSTFIKEDYARTFHEGDFTMLVQYLESYFPDESILKDLVKKIIDKDSLKFDFFIFEDCKWSEMEQLLNIVYRGDEVAVKNIKKKLILSFSWSDDYQLNFENVSLWRNAIQFLLGELPQPNDKSSMEVE